MKRVLILCLLVLVVAHAVLAQTKGRIHVGANIHISADRTRIGNFAEFHIAVDPTNPMNLLATGMFVPFDTASGGGTSLLYYSRDGGISWMHANLRRDKVGGDPRVVFTKKGTALFIVLHLDEKTRKDNTFIFRSEDKGETWSDPAILPFIDHQAVVADLTDGPNAGNLYTAGLAIVHRDANGQVKRYDGKRDYHISSLRSSDDGRSWEFIDITDTHDKVGPEFSGWGLQSTESPLIFSDGELFVPFKTWSRGGGSGQGADQGGQSLLRFATSRDGGKTYSQAQSYDIIGGGTIKAAGYQSHAIDRSNGPFRDRIYLVTVDRQARPGAKWVTSTWEGRLIFSYSSDRGKTWSKPAYVGAPKPGGGDQFVPTIAVNKDGTIAVAWYDTRETQKKSKDTLTVHQMIAASFDGGVTFTDPVKVSSEPSDPLTGGYNITGASEIIGGPALIVPQGKIGFQFTDGQRGYGDYYEIAVSPDGTFHPIWSDGRTGSSQMWTARVRIEPPGIKAEKVPELEEADVTGYMLLMPGGFLTSPKGERAVPMRLKNRSKRPVYGPFRVEVTDILSAREIPETSKAMFQQPPEYKLFLNSSNGKGGPGAVYDYSSALGDLGVLRPGEVSNAITWRIREAISNEDFPHRVIVKIFGRVEKGTAQASTAKSN